MNVELHSPQERRARSLRRRWAWLLGIALGSAFAFGLVATWRERTPPAASLPIDSEEDPRRTFITPFRNVRPEVRYVGDETCASCHVSHAQTYRRHPMGRSLAPISTGIDSVRYDRESHNPFRENGSLFSVERRNGRLFHKESDRGPDGRAHLEQEAEIAFVVGSGSHGRSYLIDRDGYLFFSPISWYSQDRRWNLSPGSAASNHFSRAITGGCLFCHCNRAEEAADAVNHFRPPIFHGYAIGCERCHGPGELHQARRESDAAETDVDDTIVNPRHLSPELRDAVCEQCHLQGAARILRRGRQWFDYRPGLPLSQFLSVFVATNADKETDVVGHVEQMHLSRCYQQSAGQMGCVSCHDPHQLPEATAKTNYYRQRCLNCHAQKGCTLPLASRRRQEPSDNCIACHMPRGDSATVGHVVLTDHRILRRAGTREVEPPVRWPRDAASLPIRYHPSTNDANEDRRDYALALMEAARTRTRKPSQMDLQRKWYSEAALPLLHEAVVRRPEDVPAREAKAHALWFLGRLDDARLDFESTLERAPQREDALVGAARVAQLLGRNEAAQDFAERLVRVNPWSWEHHHQLASVLVENRHWQRAAVECDKSLALNPWGGMVRPLRIRCLLAVGDRKEAEAELHRLLPMVADPEALRRWFAEQTEPRP